MIHSAKQLYYRGYLTACNYACNYCPFAKKNCTEQDLMKDQKGLERFFCYVKEKSFDGQITLLITPYGEAMIHEYYMDALIAFAQLQRVKSISIQTNLSFDIDRFIGKVQKSGVEKSKIKFWATFHPTMVSVAAFADNVRMLAAHFELCVGMVAIRRELEAIGALRELLPEHIYFWINAQAGYKTRYSKNEIETLKKIDPCFENEFPINRKSKSLPLLEEDIGTEEKNSTNVLSSCNAGRSSFLVEVNGAVRACHENRTVLFNIYSKEDKQCRSEFSCQQKNCDCYLAYSNLHEVKMKHFFGDQLAIRIPERHGFRAVFLDIDGTMTEPDGRLRSSIIRSAEWLRQRTKLYFVTALPMDRAKKKCSPIWTSFDGGIFSNGARVVDQSLGREFEYTIDAKALLREAKAFIDTAQYLSIDQSSEDSILRIILPRSIAQKLQMPKNLHAIYEGQKAYVQHAAASKLNGIKRLQEWMGYQTDEILVMGNSACDLEMVKGFPYSAATLDAPEELRKSARYVLEVEHLPYICK